MIRFKAILTVFCLSVAIGWGATETKPTTTSAPTTSDTGAKNKVVVIKLDGKITEAPPGIDIGLPDIQLNIFWDQLRLIRMLKNDNTVKALVVLINEPKLEYAQSQELAMELDQLRASGKKVFVHSDSIPASVYAMTLPANRIAMTPGSVLELVGVSAQLLYYKDLMDKLGIQAQVEHMGKYKLFGEPFTATQPSEYMSKQVDDLLDSMYGQITGGISKYRRMSVDKVKSIIDQGPFLAEEAVEFGLIDQLSHRSDFLEQVRKDMQGTLVFNYARTTPPDIKSGLGGLLQIFSMIGSKGTETSANKVAIVYVTGVIIEGESESPFDSSGTAGSETIRKAFAEIKKDDMIKAIVVRVDSPGGSSTASEIIWGAIHEASKTRPVVISMGSMAGSGGYYVAAAGNTLFASPATMTGSIGVVVGKAIMKDLLGKIYLKQYNYARGKNAAIDDPFIPLTEEQRLQTRKKIAEAFELFKQRVREGRRDKIKNLDELATGMVYTGEQGIKLGLVDKIGTLADAVALAAEQAKIKSYQVVHLPKPKTLPEILLEGLGYKVDPDDVISSNADERMVSLLGGRRMDLSLGLAGISPSLVYRTILLVKMMRKGGVLAISPYHISIK